MARVMHLAIEDLSVRSARCPCERHDLTMVYGAVLRAEDRCGLYLTGVPSARGDVRYHCPSVFLAVACVRDAFSMAYRDCVRTVGLRVWATATDVEMLVLPAADVESHMPASLAWAGGSIFGTVLDRAEALESPLIDEVWQIADFIVSHDPRVEPFLNEARYLAI